jgi:uncharacterized protein DUF4386
MLLANYQQGNEYRTSEFAKGGRPMKDNSLARVGGFAAIAVAVLSILYAVAYLFITPAAQRGADPAAYFASFAADPTGRQLANLCFVFSGVLGSFAVAAISERLRSFSEGWARWALVVGVMALVATCIHGFWNMTLTPTLARLYNEGDAATKAAVAVVRSTPVPADPVELFTFGFTGLWALVVGLLTLRGADLPRRLGYLALVAGVDTLLLFISDIAGASTAVLVTGGLASLILVPAMWVSIGLTLLRDSPAPAAARTGVGASSV